MIGTDVRCVQRADAIGEHANAIAAQTADDGPTRAGPVGSGANAGQGGECFAERRLLASAQFFADESRRALSKIEGGLGIGADADEKRIELEDVFGFRTVRCIGGGEQARAEEEGN